jgi:hypothetical protein
MSVSFQFPGPNECVVSCPTPEERVSGCSACEIRNSKAATDFSPRSCILGGLNRSQAFRSELRMISSQAKKVTRWATLTALINGRQHARMPLLVLGMSITEPPVAFRAMHGRRVITRLIASETAWHKRPTSSPVFHFSHHRRGYLLQIRKAIVSVPQESYFV